MEPDHAKQILRSLADGHDPTTGAPFPPNSPYQQADTVRALYMALEAMDRKPRTKNQEPRTAGPQTGQPWSTEEDQQLRDEHAAHTPLAELATAHGRTQGAITSRLLKLGLLQDTANNRAGQGTHPMNPIHPIPPPSSAGPQATGTKDEDFPF